MAAKDNTLITREECAFRWRLLHNVGSYCPNHLQGETPTLPHRPTQPRVAAYLQLWRISPIFQSLPNKQYPNMRNPCHTRTGCIGGADSNRGDLATGLCGRAAKRKT